MAKRQSQKPGFSAQTLISNLQSQLDSDGELRASLAGELTEIESGSNAHLLELLDVSSVIEDDVNELLCELSLLQSALETYRIAATTSSSNEIDLCEATSVFINLLPKHHDWDARISQQFKRLHSLSRGLAY